MGKHELSAQERESLAQTMCAWEEAGIEETWAPDVSLRSRSPLSTHSTVEAKSETLPQLGLGEDESDEFQIVETLGAGGMGRVDLAYQRSLRRQVAVKTLHSERLGEEQTLGRLFEEAYVTGRLEHPNIVPIHALAYDEGVGPLLVMKRISGEAWREQLQREADGRDSKRFLVAHVEILMQVCNAVQFAHSKGVLHLDIKPDNVMLGDFGEVYLVDWGVAVEEQKLQQLPETWVVGTPAYMAPEMTKGLHAVERRTDVYLLGSTLHEILTGQTRHAGDDLPAVILSSIRSEPHSYPEEVPQELAAICNKACHSDPSERFASAQELHEALAGYLQHRASYELAEASSRRFVELQYLLSRRDLDPKVEYLRLQELAAECRFGFQQALREWPDNGQAQSRLRLLCESMAEFEIEQRHAGAASSWLASLSGEHPDLEQRLAQLQAKLDEEAQASVALEQIKKDATIRSYSTWARTLFGVVFGLLLMLVCFAAAIAEARGLLSITPTLNLQACAGLVTLSALAMLLKRKMLIVNQITGRLFALLFVFMFALVANRLIGVSMGLAVHATLIVDLLLGALFAATVSVLLRPASLLTAGLAAVAALGAAQAPEYAWYFFGLTLFLFNLDASWAARPSSDFLDQLLAKD